MLTVYLKKHLSLPTDHDCISINTLLTSSRESSASLILSKTHSASLFSLLAGSGSRLGLAGRKRSDTPVTWLFQVQKLEDRLAIHIRRCVKASDIQDRRGQVDVENNLWDTERDTWSCPSPETSGGGTEGHFLHPMSHCPLMFLPSLSDLLALSGCIWPVADWSEAVA